MSDDDFAGLLFGVLLILEDPSQWVSEDSKRFFKSNSMTG